MGDNKGTDFTISEREWFITEAECVTSLESLDELFEGSTDGSDISNLIDETDCSQGNSLALFNEQLTEEHTSAILDLKRKFTTSPEQPVADLSPRLQAIRLTPQRTSKRRLFEDSGIAEDEAESSNEKVVDVEQSSNSNDDNINENLNLLTTTNYKVILYSKCKEKFGVSFTELTRSFKSNKTCTDQWIIFAHCIRSELIEACKIQLQAYCDYFQVMQCDFSIILCVLFKAVKNRETLTKLLTTILNCNELQLLSDPPRTRSPAVAIFIYQKTFGNASYKYGELPEWVKKQTLLSHESANTAESFDLSQMIQFCYDNNLQDECSIAYRYAQHAEVDSNAAAFLKHNSQAKFVKDACCMVRYYKRQEMRELTISEWIWRCCDECSEDGDWKVIAQLFKYQQINFISFLSALRPFLKGIPKKQCIVFYGPSDTGKSYLCNSLIQFMQGKVVSMINRNSTFWLQPLIDAKIGFIDDVTYPGWQYLDVNMRGALDGHAVSIDAKHKAPMQLKLPPMLVTTNVNLEEEVTLKYIKSRVQIFHFPNKFPLNEDGSVIYEITNKAWKCFFRKLGNQIDLEPKEDLQDESGRSDKPFRCTAGQTNESL
ncbi:E1 [Gammapapillomavirus 22]|uniref:Replication protein E1 n=2 Tax=Papillomaviridae TaxID=151340 RepID=A0A385PHI8_9PAPI|nr:E1 [Gammapapillomavirus 22]AYA93390.1 MAG: E1 protein [Human papillomavirus]